MRSDKDTYGSEAAIQVALPTLLTPKVLAIARPPEVPIMLDIYKRGRFSQSWVVVDRTPSPFTNLQTVPRDDQDSSGESPVPFGADHSRSNWSASATVINRNHQVGRVRISDWDW